MNSVQRQLNSRSTTELNAEKLLTLPFSNSIRDYCSVQGLLATASSKLCWCLGRWIKKVADSYPELESEGPSFQIELNMFHTVLGGMTTRESIKTVVTLDKCATVLRDMAPPMRAIYVSAC